MYTNKLFLVTVVEDQSDRYTAKVTVTYLIFAMDGEKAKTIALKKSEHWSPEFKDIKEMKDEAGVVFKSES